jgi:3-methyladenine DNA glycosylase/8-oxoguanine DNA glycosylase
MASRALAVDGPLDLRNTLGPLGTVWARRDEAGWWRPMRTPEGTATVRIHRDDASVVVEAWGAGAQWALDRGPRFAGLDDAGHDWVAPNDRIAEMQRRRPGWRMGRTDLVFDAAVYAVLGQKVTGKEAATGLRGITRRFSERAPGPRPDLWLPPDPERIAAAPYYDFHDLGIEKKRTDTLRRLAAEAHRIDRLAASEPRDAMRYLARFRGVGEWTVNEVVVLSHGHADAVSVGDYHLKNIVCFHLAGVERGTDELMLELLEPFRPHRARVVRMLERSGGPQRKGARLAVRGFEGF